MPKSQEWEGTNEKGEAGVGIQGWVRVTSDESCPYGLCSSEPPNSIQRPRSLRPGDPPTTCKEKESWGGARGEKASRGGKGKVIWKVKKRALKSVVL